jgi:hypothetical protein
VTGDGDIGGCRARRTGHALMWLWPWHVVINRAKDLLLHPKQVEPAHGLRIERGEQSGDHGLVVGELGRTLSI